MAPRKPRTHVRALTNPADPSKDEVTVVVYTGKEKRFTYLSREEAGDLAMQLLEHLDQTEMKVVTK